MFDGIPAEKSNEYSTFFSSTAVDSSLFIVAKKLLTLLVPNARLWPGNSRDWGVELRLKMECAGVAGEPYVGLIVCIIFD